MSEVHFGGLSGNYGYYQNDNSNKKAEENNFHQASVAPEAKSADPSKVLDALSFMGAQNFVKVTGKAPVNPSDFLSDDRIKGIEDSMKLFEEGTEKYADAIKQEFGNMFSEDTVYALAANAFALDA